jgi:hypothetical protein
MVSKKRVKLNLEIDIDIPTDLITNRTRIQKVEDGIIKSIYKGCTRKDFHLISKNLVLI